MTDDRAVRLSEGERERLIEAIQSGDQDTFVESLLASRERAAAERAWDEGVGYMAERCVDEHGVSATYQLSANPYRQEDRNG